MQKILGLELLRGVCALLVALSHCFALSDISHPPTWGPYSVYVFFAISGAVIYLNYHHVIGKDLSVAQFLVRRFARLAPMIWAAILIPAVLHLNFIPDLLLLNLSLLQGFASPGNTSYLMGGWSLGIEFILYALFPALLSFMTSNRSILITLAALFVLRFAFLSSVTHDTDFQGAAKISTEVGAFLFFFFGGMAVGKWRLKVPIILSIACFAILFAAPFDGIDAAALGFKGMALSTIAVLLVACSFYSPKQQALRKMSEFFGDISYGLYILHPIAWYGLERYSPGISVLPHILLTLGLSIAASWASLRIYEKPVRRWIIGAYGR